MTLSAYSNHNTIVYCTSSMCSVLLYKSSPAGNQVNGLPRGFNTDAGFGRVFEIRTFPQIQIGQTLETETLCSNFCLNLVFPKLLGMNQVLEHVACLSIASMSDFSVIIANILPEKSKKPIIGSVVYLNKSRTLYKERFLASKTARYRKFTIFGEEPAIRVTPGGNQVDGLPPVTSDL